MVISLADRERPPARSPKPDSRLNVLGTLAATSLALVAYFFALLVNFKPPPTFAGVLFTIAPACAIPAAVLLAVRARAEQDDALRAVTAGLAIGCFAMVLQLTSFRPISPGGGIFDTSTAGSSMLYIVWHVALPAGVLAATIGRPRASRRTFGLIFGVVVTLLCAIVIPNSWQVVHSDGSYYGGLIIALALVMVFTLAVVAAVDADQRPAPQRHPRVDHHRDGAVGVRHRAERGQPAAVQQHLVGQPGDSRAPRTPCCSAV